MKNLFGIFKKEQKSIFSSKEYQSIKVDQHKNTNSANSSEYELENTDDVDEMQIDKIYQSL